MAAANEIMCNEGPEKNLSKIFPADVVIWLYNEQVAVVLWPGIYFSGIFMFWGIIGNGFVVYAYGLKFRKTVANIYILWLAFCDMVCCIIIIPFEIFQLRFSVYSYTDAPTCKIFRMLSFTAYTLQGLTLLCIAMDRYFKVCKPLKMHSCRNPVYFLATTVSVSVIMSWPAALIYGIKTIHLCIPGVYGKSCSIDDSVKDTIFPSLFYGSLLCLFVVSLFILCILYIKIVRFIWQWKNNAFPYSRQRDEISRSSSTDVLKGTNVPKVLKQNKSTSLSHHCGIYYIKEDCELLNHEQKCKIHLNKINKYKNSMKKTNETPFNAQAALIRHSDTHVTSVPRNESGQTTIIKQKYRKMQSRLKDQARTSKSVSVFAAVTICFVISYVPYLSCEILLKTSLIQMHEQSVVIQKIIEVAEKSYCVSNACNPIIYSIFNPDFVRVCLDLFKVKNVKVRI